MPALPKFLDGLRTLVEYEVEFIVVGGVAAVLHGAPVNTFDIDIVHARSAVNIDRLLAALNAMDAFYRGRPGPPLAPTKAHLESAGHQLLVTRFGPLDVLGTVGDSRAYVDLMPHTVEHALGQISIRVLDLETLIEIKEFVGRDKDLAVLPVLRRTLQLSKD